jgi:hypothetical protein
MVDGNRGFFCRHREHQFTATPTPFTMIAWISVLLALELDSIPALTNGNIARQLGLTEAAVNYATAGCRCRQRIVGFPRTRPRNRLNRRPRIANNQCRRAGNCIKTIPTAIEQCLID